MYIYLQTLRRRSESKNETEMNSRTAIEARLAASVKDEMRQKIVEHTVNSNPFNSLYQHTCSRE